MKHYRKPAGHYIKIEDSVPVSETLIEVGERPSENHVFANIWITDETAQTFDPMNPEVCWRLKTTQELDAEKTDTAKKLPDYKLAIKALAKVTWNSVPALKTAFPTYAEYQTAIINQYKALL